MSVNISVGGKWHFYEIAIASQEANILNKFYTSVHFKNAWIVNSELGRALNFPNRHDERLDKSLIKGSFLSETLPWLLKKGRILNDAQALTLRCEMFDKWVTRNIEPSNILHSQDGFCLHTAKKAKKEGAVFICDRGIIAGHKLQEITNSEYEKFGIIKDYPDVMINEKAKKEHKLADYILVPTQTVFNSLVEEGVEAEKIVVIPYGVDLKMFSGERKIDKKRFRIIFVGSVSLRKGVHYLLEAWKNLNLSNAELVIIGDIENGIETIIKKYQDHFTHIPYINQRDLIDYYLHSDVFILPSLAEGSARVIYEAMACGLPVIYTDMAGSIARDQIDGFEINAYSVEDIMDKILYFYNHRDDIEDMGKNAKDWIKNFTWESYRSKISQLYLNIINKVGE